MNAEEFKHCLRVSFFPVLSPFVDLVVEMIILIAQGS